MDSAQLDQQSCPGLNFSCHSAAIMPLTTPSLYSMNIYLKKDYLCIFRKNMTFILPSLIYRCRRFTYPSCFSAAWDMKVWNQHVPGLTQLQVTMHRCGNDPLLTGWSSGRTKRTGAELLIRWQWQKWGCRRPLPPGLPLASCAYLPEVLVVDSGEDSWCSLQVSGSPYWGEWAPSAHLGWLPIQQIRQEHKSNTSLTTVLSQL